MLIIKTLMVVGSLVLFSYFFVAAHGRPVEKLGISLVFVGIAFFAIFPTLSDQVANFVGVDRGADLMLYLSTMALLFLSFHLYLRQKKLQSDLQAVVRAIGLLTLREGRGRPPEPDVADHPGDEIPPE
jgi:hypothetical protein